MAATARTPAARSLRRAATAWEQLLWRDLRDRHAEGFKFRRQQPAGPFVVDFLCREARLIVELDGRYHESTEEADRTRQAYLEAKGYQVLRFANEDVRRNREGVLHVIADALRSDPHPDPLPQAGEGARMRRQAKARRMAEARMKAVEKRR